MPYSVTSSATVTVEIVCASCGHAWYRMASGSHTTEPTWRRGVQGAARGARSVAEGVAETNALKSGHVCEKCGRLSTYALKTFFGDGFEKGLVELYDRSLEEAGNTSLATIVGIVFSGFLGLWFPWVGGALAAVLLVVLVKVRLSFKECRALRDPVVTALALVSAFPGPPLEEIAVHCAMAGMNRQLGGSFEPELGFCQALVAELRRRKLITSPAGTAAAR